MLLYHGTTLEIKEPKIITSEVGRDFGFAFYTTDIQEQAERWAIRRAKIERSYHGANNFYTYDDLYQKNDAARQLSAAPRHKFAEIKTCMVLVH